MSVFVDTLVLVRAFDGADPAKQRVAQSILESSERLVVSTQVLLETWWLLTRGLAKPLDEATATEVIRELSRLPVIQADAALVARAIETARRWQLTIWQAMVVESALSAACSKVLTEDLADGQEFDGLVVENPFLG